MIAQQLEEYQQYEQEMMNATMRQVYFPNPDVFSTYTIYDGAIYINAACMYKASPLMY